jgi:CHAT domain-containing protein/tetratricopeptide (TPR) repeat protein
MNDKLAHLEAIMALQRRAGELMFEANRLKDGGALPAAAVTYEELTATLERLLEAIQRHNRAYPDSPFDLVPTVDQQANSLLTEADVRDALGQWDRAESLRARALRASEQHLSASQLADRKRQLASVFKAQGRFHQALIALAEARDTLSSQGRPVEAAAVTAELSETLEWLGDEERAVEELRRGQDLLQQLLGREPSSQQRVLQHVQRGELAEGERMARLLAASSALTQIDARIEVSRGNYPRARALYLGLAPQIPASAGPAIAFQLARIDVLEGNAQQGLQALDAIAPNFQGLLRPKLGVLLSWRAEALRLLGRTDEALPVVEESVRELESLQDLDSLWKSYRRLGSIRRELSRKREALEAFLAGADVVARLRMAPLGYRLDSSYLADKRPLFDEAIGLAAELGDAQAGCRLIEFVKARALTALLTVPRVPSAGEAALEQQVDALSRRLVALDLQAPEASDKAAMEARKNELLAERSRLIERIRIADPRWRAMTEPVPFDASEVLARLTRRRQAAISVYLLPDRLVAVLLHAGQMWIESLPLAEGTRGAIDSYGKNLQAEEPEWRDFDPAQWPELEAEKLLPAGLLERALSSEGVVMVPHGPLHLLPWAALVHRGERLFERCPFGVVPNLSCLAILDQPLAPAPRVAVLGPPPDAPGRHALVHAAEENVAVAKTYGTERLVAPAAVAEGASRDAFLKLAARSDAAGAILHAICHGDVVAGDPSHSGLLLAGGRVDAAEIANLSIRFEEVVLAACSLGQRPPKVGALALSGDDVVGIPGAFLEAGARSLLASIPPAADQATVELMVRYHQQRAEGTPPMLALQRTARAMLAAGEYPLALWGGFTVFGCQ